MSSDDKRPKRVLVMEEGASDAVSPQDAPPPPSPDHELLLEQAEAAETRRSGLGFWMRLFLWAGGLLLTLSIALSIDQLVRELMAASPWLAWTAAALAALTALALLVLIFREIAALARLGRVEGIREMALSARASGAPREAKAVAGQLQALYAGRRDIGVDWRRLRDQAEDAVDAPARLALYERRALGPLDEQARVAVRHAARRVALFTTIAPSALLDALGALYFNLAMIRRLAEIYGGRAGFAGTWRLARRVVAHAMAAGLIAVGEDLLEPLLGGGVAGKISRRVGEGVVNGALTARLGVAAMEVCRPLPFDALDKPKLRELAWDALKGG